MIVTTQVSSHKFPLRIFLEEVKNGFHIKAVTLDMTLDLGTIRTPETKSGNIYVG